MGDSNSFTSLFALVDSHLSRSNIKQDESKPSTSGTFRLPSLRVQRGLSDTGLASARFPVPSLSLSEHPINNALANQISSMLHKKEPKEKNQESDDDTDDDDADGKPVMSMSDCSINHVLAVQLSNMFKARKAKEEEEKRLQLLKKAEVDRQRQRLEESSCLIDLMPAVQQARQYRPQDVAILSSSSSTESLVVSYAQENLENELQESVAAMDIHDRAETPKPITQDMSYMLKHKIGKCSPFGKVLCARYRPVAAPYFKSRVPSSNIKVFDFTAPSPDDIVLARFNRPTPSYVGSNSMLTVND